jgi:hypothetical protein
LISEQQFITTFSILILKAQFTDTAVLCLERRRPITLSVIGRNSIPKKDAIYTSLQNMASYLAALGLDSKIHAQDLARLRQFGRIFERIWVTG